MPGGREEVLPRRHEDTKEHEEEWKNCLALFSVFTQHGFPRIPFASSRLRGKKVPGKLLSSRPRRGAVPRRQGQKILHILLQRIADELRLPLPQFPSRRQRRPGFRLPAEQDACLPLPLRWGCRGHFPDIPLSTKIDVGKTLTVLGITQQQRTISE
jgi:hypothetical protein